MITVCSKCGGLFAADVRFCPQCGTPTSSYYSQSGSSPHDPTIPAAADSSTHTTAVPSPRTYYGSNPYEVNPYAIPVLPPPPRRPVKLGLIIGLVVLIIVLASASIFAMFSLRTKRPASTASTSSISTKSPISNRSPLYVADWSNGLNGWSGTADWTISNGMLINDGTGSLGAIGPKIVAPYRVSVADYAVEVRMQVVGSGYDSACFGITLRGTSTPNGWQGYQGGINFGGVCVHSGDIEIVGDDNSSLARTSFEPGNAWHTYRLGAKGNIISFQVDSGSIIQVNDNKVSSGGQVGLWSLGVKLNIVSFKVIAL